MDLPQLDSEELSYLAQLESPSNVDNVDSQVTILRRDENLNWHSLGVYNNVDLIDQNEYSDTESLTSNGTAVPSPAIFDSADCNFSFPISDGELKELSVKALNTRLKGLPKDVVSNIKKRRRTLKNRGYAHSCRVKRIAEKSSLQQNKAQLESTIRNLQQQLIAVTSERDQYKSRFEGLFGRLMGMQRKNA